MQYSVPFPNGSEKIFETEGNVDILKGKRIAFLASSRLSEEKTKSALEFAERAIKNGKTVVCGSESRVERAVAIKLLAGGCPLIIVLARGMFYNVPEMYKKPMASGKLLLISEFDERITTIDKNLCYVRNQTVIDLADEVVALPSEGGMIEKLIRLNDDKKITVLR